jgi:hypothetical protein
MQSISVTGMAGQNFAGAEQRGPREAFAAMVPAWAVIESNK